MVPWLCEDNAEVFNEMKSISAADIAMGHLEVTGFYANQNYPNLKTEYPIWTDRIKQIAKIWKSLPNEKRQPYVQHARENRTASRMNKQVSNHIMMFRVGIVLALNITPNNLTYT